MTTPRVFFLGAGASKQDRFPLTSELKYGIAWAIQKEPQRFQLLREHLQRLYSVDVAAIAECSARWEALRRDDGKSAVIRWTPMPDVTDLLSALDWVIREQGSFGPGASDGHAGADGGLTQVRDLVVQGLCFSLALYGSLEEAPAARDFVRILTAADTLLTTNWDLLLDAARDGVYGSAPEDYGTTGNVALAAGHAPRRAERPRLLKLHGSLSWRYCQRCHRLVIDPMNHVAGERQVRASCDCTCPYTELIVTPGFVREYRNVHLLTIWREALLALALAQEWVFVGYSLPPDDIGIRTLLMRARCIRRDIAHEEPEVTVVTSLSDSEATLERYLGILPGARLGLGPFGAYVARALAQVHGASA